jgi:hypothetical protein
MNPLDVIALPLPVAPPRLCPRGAGAGDIPRRWEARQLKLRLKWSESVRWRRLAGQAHAVPPRGTAWRVFGAPSICAASVPLPHDFNAMGACCVAQEQQREQRAEQRPISGRDGRISSAINTGSATS